jgi:hypothetical protein
MGTPVTRRLRFILLLLSTVSLCSKAALGAAPEAATTQRAVAVILALESAREHLVPWHNTLTLDAAIQAAARKPRHEWKEAWRFRRSFWTRNFRDPHSFWARLLAGEKATGYTYFQNTPRNARSTALQPGDRIYVDLSPIE